MSVEQRDRVAETHRRTIHALHDSLAALESLLSVERGIAARDPENAEASEDIAHAERELEATNARIARLEGLMGQYS